MNSHIRKINGFSVIRYDSNDFLTDATLEEIIELINDKTKTSMKFLGELEYISQLETLETKTPCDCYFVKKGIDGSTFINGFYMYKGKSIEGADEWLEINKDMQIYKATDMVNMVDSLFATLV